MDMSFTKDPVWIKERKKLWRQTAKRISPGLKPKQLEALQHYFFTGQVTDGEPVSLGSRLWMFPKVDIESIQHVLKHNYPDARGDEKNLSDLITFLQGGMQRAPGISLDEVKCIFRYTFGDVFQSNCELPFLLNDETHYQTVSLNPHPFFASGADVSRWLMKSSRQPSLWSRIPDYWFSLIEYVDPIIFRVNEDCRYSLGLHLAFTRLSLMELLEYCAHDIDVTDGAEEGQARRDYMRHFREKMEALSGPSDLIELWQQIKASSP